MWSAHYGLLFKYVEHLNPLRGENSAKEHDLNIIGLLTYLSLIHI